MNQAVLGLTETTTKFKNQHQLPGRISIPGLLNMQGQVLLIRVCYGGYGFVTVITALIYGPSEPLRPRDYTLWHSLSRLGVDTQCRSKLQRLQLH